MAENESQQTATETTETPRQPETEDTIKPKASKAKVKGKKDDKEKKKTSWFENMMDDPLYRWFGWGGILIIVAGLGYLGYIGYGVIQARLDAEAAGGEAQAAFDFGVWWDGVVAWFTWDNVFSLAFFSSAFSISVGITVFTLSFVDHISFLKGEHKDFKTLMVSTGLLGTFVGIFIGLLDFNVEDIDASVPLLLEGLKTAFITSIMAVFCVIVLSFLQAKPQLEGTDDSSLFQSMVNSLEVIADSQNNIEKTREGIESLSQQISKLNDANIAINNTLARISDVGSKQAVVINDLKTQIHQISSVMQSGDNMREIKEICNRISDNLGSSGVGSRGGRSGGLFG